MDKKLKTMFNEIFGQYKEYDYHDRQLIQSTAYLLFGMGEYFKDYRFELTPDGIFSQKLYEDLIQEDRYQCFTDDTPYVLSDFDKKNISNFKKILDDYSKFKVRNYELAKYDLITFLSGLSILRSMHINRLDGGYLRINYLLAKQYPKFSSKFDNLFICSILMKYSLRNIL